MSTHTIAPNASLSEADAVRRLLFRLGLGPRPGDLAEATARGFSATLAALTTPATGDPGVAATPVPALAVTTPPPKGASVQERQAARQARAAEGRTLGVWWLNRMAAVSAPYPERMTWFWHTHFATSMAKVTYPRLMYQQNDTFRRLGLGDFRTLAKALIIDPAMLIWLDGQGNQVRHPNENLAREFMELFTLGVGNYSEEDVRSAARALTGWHINYTTDAPQFNPRAHDPGPETVLGRAAGFDAPGLVDLLLAQPSSPRYLVNRIWTRFVSDTPPDQATTDRLIAAYGPGQDITALVRAAVSTPEFRDPASVLVKEPVLWLVGAMRALRMQAGALPEPALRGALNGLGQIPLAPPDVGGWPAGVHWLTTAASLTRAKLAQQLASHGDVSPVANAAPAARVDATAALLGLPGFTDRTAAALHQLTDQPAQLVALALASPEYTVSA